MKRRLHSEDLVLIQLATFRSTLVRAMRCQHEQTQWRSHGGQAGVKRMLYRKLGSHKLRSTGPERHCAPRALKHPVSHTSPVGQQIVLMFQRFVWKPSLTLCVVWPPRRGRDIICWIFTLVSARRKQQQEKTWPPQTAVSRKQTHSVCFTLTHTGFTHAGLHCLHRLQQSVRTDAGRTARCQMLTNED